ncbi:MAG: hypothetical protein ACOYVG_10785 [Bacteroidota bacterium]
MKKQIFFCASMLSFLVILLGACKKYNNYEPNSNLAQQVNDQAIKRFLTLPHDAGPALQRIVADLEKAEKKHAFLTKHLMRIRG